MSKLSLREMHCYIKSNKTKKSWKHHGVGFIIPHSFSSFSFVVHPHWLCNLKSKATQKINNFPNRFLLTLASRFVWTSCEFIKTYQASYFFIFYFFKKPVYRSTDMTGSGEGKKEQKEWWNSRTKYRHISVIWWMSFVMNVCVNTSSQKLEKNLLRWWLRCNVSLLG